MHRRAKQLIEELALQPHPEGGFFREIHRSPLKVQPQDARPLRNALTTIYFLLPAASFSRWHCVASDEVWHLYEGGPLELRIADPRFEHVDVRRLEAVTSTTGPVAIVPASYWQAARPLSDYALIGATVGPGFEFSDFRFLSTSSELAGRLHDPVDRSLL
ncbi:MAG TPA: cupin domain-containing protein [Steroidobacteraceae bacterium]|nr:cupin domain-containing protein [Steroidobacteraceae bacterium]